MGSSSCGNCLYSISLGTKRLTELGPEGGTGAGTEQGMARQGED